MTALSSSSPTAVWEADSLTQADSTAISSLPDGSGNGYTATNTGGGPIFKTGITPTGKPVMRVGTGQWFTTNAPLLDGDFTVIMVGRPNNVSTVRTVIGNNLSGAFQYRLDASHKSQTLRRDVAGIGLATNAMSTTAIGVHTAVVDVRGGVRVTASGSYSTTPAINTGDSNASTEWYVQQLTPWLQFELDHAIVATGYRLRTSPAYSVPHQPKNWQFQGSNDASTWTTLDTITNSPLLTSSAGVIHTFTMSNSTAYKFYRLNVTANNGGDGVHFADMWVDAASESMPRPITYSFYEDGVANGSGAAAFTFPAVSTARLFHAGNTGAEYMDGDIAGVYYWNRALQPTERAAIEAELRSKWITGAAVPATTTGVGPVTVASSSTTSLIPVTTGTSAVGVGSSSRTVPVLSTSGTAPVVVASSSATSLVGSVVTTGTSPVSVGSSSVTELIEADVRTTAGTSPIAVGSAARTYTVGAALPEAEIPVGVTVEVGAVTVLNLVALPAVEVRVGVGVETGDALAVVPLPPVSIEVGCSVIARPVDVVVPDPRRRASQWRYVMTDLANMPLGELTDLEHDPVEDGVGEPATMQFSIATDSDQHALIKPIERQCQVWDGDRLLLRGPVLPGQPSDDGTTMTYKIHDPSWFWRDGRRVITRTPQKNLLHNGDFKSGLTYWTRGYDKDSIPKAAPNVRVVTEDFVDDTDGLDPIKAAEIFGVESVTESELSSNAVFWPNLATFRPGGVASVEAVANAMPTTAGLKVTVVGHTANDGTGNGLGLSLRRAQAAAAIIHGKRPGAVITTKGVGFYDPKPGYPIDSQEQRRVVIQYDQTITGKSKQWMKQTVEVTHPKSARYGLELTAGAMLKVADDWSVEDANMMSVRLVARRKSAPSKIFDEGSASISDTDPVDRWIPQATSVTIPADDRAYLVDVYLYAPAAVARYTSVGLFPEEMLYFWGVDQALIFKGVMEHIQKPEFGYADLGVDTRTPLTGIRRDREFAFRELTPADTALDGLMGISRGIEWDTVTTATSTTATTFYPRQGKTVDYVLAQGGNVVQAVPANTRDVGSAIIAQAQNLGSYRAVAYASDKKAFGGTLIQRVITAEQDTPLNELGETAKAELFWAKSSTPAYWVDIDPDSIEEVLASTAKGDTVRLILDYPTQVDALARIVRRQIHPDSLRLMVAFEEA